MKRVRRGFSGRLRPLMGGVVLAAAIAGCGGAVSGGATDPAAVRALRYVDPQGWSLRYPSSLSLERSTSGPGMATFTEITVANFAQRRAVVSGRTRDGGFIRVLPPLDHRGRFPSDGVAFRVLAVEGPPMIGTQPDSRFPITLSSFKRSRPGSFPPRDYASLGVPHELTRPIDADGQHYQALVLIGPAASARTRAAIKAVIASLAFPPLRSGEQVGDETVLGPASSYPVGSFTLVHAPGQVCDGSVYRCHPGSQPFYLVHAPGRLHRADLIQPCEPTAAACTPPGGFYALGWTSEDVRGGYRSACHLRFDAHDEQFYCTNSPARWDRAGRVIRMPPGARFPDGLQFAFAKVAWDGHVVFLPGLGGNPPSATAYSLLWPAPSGAIVQGSAASCAGLTPSEQFSAAKVVFDALMLPGATAPGTNGVLASPARARVEHYLKGKGPAVITVQTAIETLPGGAMRVSEDAIRPRSGERWRIYARSTTEPYATSICLGSHRLAAHFTTTGISFDYPADWHARTYRVPPAPFPSGPFTSWIVWLSPQPMHPPCVIRHGTPNTTVTCRDPISHLRADSILAYWTTNTSLTALRPGPGIPITVGGRRGTWRVQTDTAQAPDLGETELITVTVPMPSSRNSWDQLSALVRGPNVAPLTAQLKTMLRTVQWRRH